MTLSTRAMRRGSLLFGLAVLAFAPFVRAANGAGSAAGSSAGSGSAEEPMLSSAEAEAKKPKIKAADTWRDTFGEVSLGLVERFGRIEVGHAERGQSGSTFGSGFELRFMLQPGWGAYYRWANGATNSGDGFDWYHLHYALGFSRRLHSTGTSELWSFRSQSRLDFGFSYFQAGTNASCSDSVAAPDSTTGTRTWAPLGTTCVGTRKEGNASGAGIGMEVRVGGEIGFGPLALGLDLGLEGYRRWSTGSGSVSIPGWFYMPTAQIYLGLALPYR